jgi:hypothetical protein
MQRTIMDAIGDLYLERAAHEHGISTEVIAQARTVAENAPDPRAERVLYAKQQLGQGKPDSADVAQTIISSILDESVA